MANFRLRAHKLGRRMSILRRTQTVGYQLARQGRAEDCRGLASVEKREIDCA
jgi:hypothetical protein